MTSMRRLAATLAADVGYSRLIGAGRAGHPLIG